jgi:ParB-like chromosome segregation protein Spo0J
MSDLVPIPKRGAHDSPHLSRDIPSAFVPIELLLPYARNARTHSDAQVAQIAASIVEWGWTNPILADAKGIVAGHGRLAAARLLYGQGRVLHLPSGEDVPAGCVPCIDVSGWSDTARRAYVLADNQLALQAGWDDAMLAEELRSIRDDGFDISLAGFDDLPALEPIADIKPSQTKEIDEAAFALAHRCPACGFEFNDE